jgi:colicin import membrane protein
MKMLACTLVISAFLGAQEPPAAPKPAEPAASVKAPEKAKAAGKVTEDQARMHATRRAAEMDKREVQADRQARAARAFSWRASRAAREKARQAAFKRAEADALKKADRAKRQADGFQKQADAQRKRADEIRRKAEASWKAYQAATRPSEPPKPKAVTPAEAPKAEELNTEATAKKG